MTFKFYLELATRVQDERLLDLLRIPASASFGPGEWSVCWWSHGKTKRARSVDREKLLLKIAEDGVNELDLKWRAQGSQKSDGRVHPVGLEAYFTPSRTSALWASVPTERLASPKNERNRKSFGAGKLPDYSEFKRPRFSTLECFLEFECREKTNNDIELQHVFIDWLRIAIEESCESLNYFGYACLDGTFRKMSMASSMGGVAPWTDELGEKFENIYPILIGPVASCEGLAATLGDDCSLIRISEQALSAIVSIPPEKVEEVRRNPAVKEWVVIRDLSKLNAPAETLTAIYERRSGLSWEAPFVKR